MQLPILSFEGLDLVVYETRTDAEGHVESYDVGQYQTYDAAGQILRFEADGFRVSLHGTGDYDPAALRRAILATFGATGIPVNAQSQLDELVATAMERFSLDDQLSWLGRIAARLFARR